MTVVATADGGTVNVVRTGPRGGAPLVFLHALGLDLTWWDHQVAAFGGERDVVAVDLPGHGLSGSPDGGPTFDGLARVVGDVVAGLGAGPADVVGLSVGGMVAQTMAVSRPDLVRSLVLVATSCTFADGVRTALRERARVTRAGGMAAIAPLHLERWFPAGFRARRPDVLDRAAKVLLRQDAALHAALWEMVAGLDLGGRLGGLTCPVTVVAGAEDASAPPASGQAIVDRVAGAVLHVVAGCGHFPPLEAVDWFNAILRRSLPAG